MTRLTHVSSIIFGYLLVILSLVVVVETLGRKLFGFSLQGADELGGYVLAIASTLAFTIALLERGHIRIDIVRHVLPIPIEAALDWLAAMLMFSFSALLTWTCVQVLRETIEYGSVAPSPWATPLVYPQALWSLCMLLFLFMALWFAFDATVLLIKNRFGELIERHGVKRLEEEIAEELEDASRR